VAISRDCRPSRNRDTSVNGLVEGLLFPATDESSFVTDSVLVADGGMTRSKGCAGPTGAALARARRPGRGSAYDQHGAVRPLADPATDAAAEPSERPQTA
jgi:hypothetical protein